jgi:hypothetical protein
MSEIERETPEWAPLFEALKRAEDAWRRDDGGDELLFRMEDVMTTWVAYRQARFGATP